MGHLQRVRFPTPPRASRHIVKRVAAILLILAIFYQQRLYLIYRDALIIKFSPTDFGADINRTYSQMLRPDDEGSQLQHELLASRENWRMLDRGCEGTTFVYNGAVIKTFRQERSPFRNCAPGAPGGRWPAEIPATLLFGGHYDGSGLANRTVEGFLPVMASFMASPSPSKPEEWHLVTPFLEGGSLKNFAKQQRRQPKSYREVDANYRPAFNRLLRSLEKLHAAGFCHDDVKPGNIFVEDESHFVLGDLGNVRQISHAYHSSQLWRENDQLADCRSNDVFRALQSYLTFVRSASQDPGRFDLDFFTTYEPLGRLFWWASNRRTTINASLLRLMSSGDSPKKPSSDEIEPTVPDTPQPIAGLFLKSWRLRRAVDRVLAMQLSDGSARKWALVRLFGVPMVDDCGA